MEHYLLLLFIGLYLLHYTESTIGPGDRKSSSRIPEKIVPSSSVSSSFKPYVSSASIPKESFPPSETHVLQRNLLQENINPKSILENYQSYCYTCIDTRQFTFPTLIFITPWNNHGYDLVKIFTQKFDYISPVWFSIKRIGIEKYSIEGTHDIDSKWIETLKEQHSDIRIVPRVLFDKWPANDVHALFQSEDEKQQLSLTLKNFLIEYNHLFDGYVLELLAQFSDSSKSVLNHIISDITEHIHQIDNSTTKKKEVILTVPPVEEYFSKNDFQTLSEYLDGFIVMTYDFPTKEPGPVSPLEWIKEVMSKFLSTEIRSSVKVFLSLNFYGYRYDRIIPSPPKDQRQYHTRHVLGHDYIEFLKQYYTASVIVFDSHAHEHITLVYGHSMNGQNAYEGSAPVILIFYPSLKSIYDRLELATKFHVGAAIWDGGQGLDYFFDLF
ncbi:unnamed protein product [Rotaria sp. Silwood1]|nr:unnamed protein product [Rotaria sp. Silwood1]CAF4698089.1 unnamed protein product [Rotaria sp. Silwood1]